METNHGSPVRTKAGLRLPRSGSLACGGIHARSCYLILFVYLHPFYSSRCYAANYKGSLFRVRRSYDHARWSLHFWALVRYKPFIISPLLFPHGQEAHMLSAVFPSHSHFLHLSSMIFEGNAQG